jgi:hypothetical protein
MDLAIPPTPHHSDSFNSFLVTQTPVLQQCLRLGETPDPQMQLELFRNFTQGRMIFLTEVSG